jgi:beta-lactamase regulating signal transducer with metallopeptidase domain
MTALELLFRHSVIPSLGWVLIHFLWQGGVIALLLAVALRARDPRGAPLLGTASSRYLTACLALLAMATCPLITLSLSLPAPGDAGPPPLAEAPALPRLLTAASHGLLLSLGSSSASEANRLTATGLVEGLLPPLVLAWLLGVLALSVRLLGGWVAVQRLRYWGTRPVPGETTERFLKLARRMGITRPVILLESPLVSVPTVIGWLRAAVLVPVGALSGLPPAHLEAVLAHELAHIRRNDYLVNLLQTVVEIVLFYHPAVWWVSRCIRREREHCCDDMAVACLGDRLTYARALTALEETRHAPASLALAASGGDLLARVRRLVGLPSASTGPSATGVGGMFVITLLLAAAVILTSGATASLPFPETRSAPPVVESQKEIRQRQIEESLPAEWARRIVIKRQMLQTAMAEKARKEKLRHLKLEAARAKKLRQVPPKRLQLKAARAAAPIMLAQATATSAKPKPAQAAPKSGVRRAQAAPAAKAAPASPSKIVKGVPGPTIQDVPILDLRGVPAREVARIQSIKDVAVVVLDAKNRNALKPASMEDVGATVVAGPKARVMVDPFVELSRATLEGMSPRQELILVGIVLFKPDVTPALVNQKFASLNVTGVLLAPAGVRGALMGKAQITGTSVTLPEDAGPVAHSIGHNQFTPGYLSRLQDRSVYVNIGAVEIAPDVTEELLTQKIGTYVNIGATIGPKPLLERLKSISVTNVGTFAEEKEDDDKDTE